MIRQTCPPHPPSPTFKSLLSSSLHKWHNVYTIVAGFSNITNLGWEILRQQTKVRVSPTGYDVLPQDAEVLVSVGAALLVLKAQSVQQLVLHRVVVQAALSLQGQILCVETPTHIGETPERR